MEEYADLAREIAKIEPDGVAIVDSFGYMMNKDFRDYFTILDNILNENAMIGFHLNH